MPARRAMATLALAAAALLAGCAGGVQEGPSPTATSTPTPSTPVPQCGGGISHDRFDGPFAAGVDTPYGGALLPAGVTHVHLWTWVHAPNATLTVYAEHEDPHAAWSGEAGGSGTPEDPFWLIVGAVPAGNLTWGVTFGSAPPERLETGSRLIYQVGGDGFDCLALAREGDLPMPDGWTA